MIDMQRSDAEKMIRYVADNFPQSEEAQYTRIGKWFSNEPLSSSSLDEVTERLCQLYAYKPGECYMNAGRIAVEIDEFTFCEGFAAGFWPVSHAWVSFKGRAIDVTWPTRLEPKRIRKSRSKLVIRERIAHNLANCHYFGVEIPRELLRAHLSKCKTWSPAFGAQFHGTWKQRERALTGTFPCTTI